MGVVYLAEDKNLGRRVAIKFLNLTDHHYRARFIREARAVSILNHPNIATVYEYGESDSAQPFIVMEYVNGKSLSDALDEGLTLRRSVEIICAIGDALADIVGSLAQRQPQIVARQRPQHRAPQHATADHQHVTSLELSIEN